MYNYWQLHFLSKWDDSGHLIKNELTTQYENIHLPSIMNKDGYVQNWEIGFQSYFWLYLGFTHDPKVSHFDRTCHKCLSTELTHLGTAIVINQMQNWKGLYSNVFKFSASGLSLGPTTVYASFTSVQHYPYTIAYSCLQSIWNCIIYCLAWTEFSKRLCDHSFCT